MPILVAWLVNALRIMLATQIGAWILKALLFLGVSLGTHKLVIDPTLDAIRGLMNTGPTGGIGAVVMAWAGVLKLDVAVSMVLSAYAAAWTIKASRVFLTKTAS